MAAVLPEIRSSEEPSDSEALATEYAFVLPRGYVDAQGAVHRDGVMRLATARDEIIPQRDPRVRENESYLTVILLSRVVTRLGSLPQNPHGRDRGPLRLDLAFLQDLYRRINQEGHTQAAVTCPACNHEFTVDVAGEQRLGDRDLRERRLFEEIAYVAYHFHWPMDAILDLEHPLRLRFVEEIGQLNKRASRRFDSVRLPWPFGRSSTPPDEASPATASLASAPPVPVTACPTPAWADLPPIQRTVGEPPLVAPASPFLAAVPGASAAADRRAARP